MPRRTQAERTAATRGALLEATVDCLVSQGFDGTTTTEVAHRAGVSAGALLHHFPAKADLLCAAVGHLFELRQAEFRKAMANLRPGTDRLEAGVDLLWSMFSGPAFVAWLELWIAARCDRVLAEAVVRLDHEFIGDSQAVVRELFADQMAVKPDLDGTGLGMAYALLAGLALFRLIPGHEPAPAAKVLAAFKTLARTALPAPTEAQALAESPEPREPSAPRRPQAPGEPPTAVGPRAQQEPSAPGKWRAPQAATGAAGTAAAAGTARAARTRRATDRAPAPDQPPGPADYRPPADQPPEPADYRRPADYLRPGDYRRRPTPDELPAPE